MLSLSYRTYRCKITAVHKGLFSKMRLWNGQGFAIDETRIMTNHHVVGNTENLRLRYLINGEERKVKAIYTAEKVLGTEDDLAIIELAEPHGLPVITFADAEPEVGDTLIFVNQYGTFKVAKLHLKGDALSLLYAIAGTDCVDPTDTNSKFYDLLAQADERRRKGSGTATIYYTGLVLQPGDSGGPVFNEKGEVVAVVYGESRITFQGLACPLDAAKVMAALVQLR